MREVVVARAGAHAITLGALRTHLDGLPAGARGTGAASALEELIEQALLEEALQRRGISPDPEAARQPAGSAAAAARQEAALRRRALLEHLAAQAQVSEPELQARYARDRERFRTTRIRLRLIRTPHEDTAQAAARRIAAGEDFERLAAELNEDAALRGSGGDLGPMTRAEVPAELRTAAFSLTEPGALSAPFRTPAGWALLRLEAREEGVLQPFEAVRDLLEQQLRWERALEAYPAVLAELRRELGVHVDHEQLAALAPEAAGVRHAPVRPARPPRGD